MSSLKENYGRLTNVQTSSLRPIFRPLTTDGTLTGSRNMNVDGSVTPVEFSIRPEEFRTFNILGLSVRITDEDNPAFDDYGNVNGPLANGLTFFTTSNGVEIPLVPVMRRNIDWLEFGPQINITRFANSIRFITYVLDMSNFSDGIQLNGRSLDRFGCRINDDLTTLVGHEIGVFGNFVFNNIV